MSRQRLTITLDKHIVKLLDDTIDGARIRNRSHAIEYLLSKTLASKISQAVILAGGKGVKMRPFTYEMPKSMIPIHGRPLLEHTIILLREHNLRDIIISIGYLGEKIQEYFGDGSKLGVKISYAEQDKNGEMGTGGALKITQNLIKQNTFVMVHGDVLAEINLADLIDFHQKNGKTATVALTSVPDSSIWGVVKLHGSEIREFQEKPKRSKALSRLINSGIYVFEKEIFNQMPRQNKFSLEEKVLTKLVQSKNLAGFSFEGQWFDIGTPKIYERVLKEWKRKNP